MLTKNRKRVYIAGAITKGCLKHNVNQATAAFIALAKAGFAPFCPHWSVFSRPCADWIKEGEVVVVGSANGHPEMSHDDWMAVDLPWVAASDVLLRLPGESTGADMEVSVALVHGIPVYHSLESLIEAES